MGKKEETLRDIFSRMEKLGDLPVFSASVNHICALSTDPESDAMSLSQEVLKDANLSVKLLRLANSSYYNRSMSKVNVVSRAVIMLGFDTVKNLSLTMKLIESFQHEHPGIDMDKLLVKAYITAGFVRDLAMKCQVEDAEQTYTCALLHNLGEIAVAYFLPDRYIEIESLNKEGEHPTRDNEVAVLGATMATIGREVAASWEFSQKVISNIGCELPVVTGAITKPGELNQALAGYANKIVGNLYDDTRGEVDLREMMADLATATGTNLRDVESSLKNSFQMSCELALEYGLSRKKLMPSVVETGDEGRDKLANNFAYLASSTSAGERSSNENDSASDTTEETASNEVSSEPQASDAPEGPEFDPMLQLQFIQEITSLITDGAKLNTVLIKILEGVHVALGFERVVLCLLDRDRKSYGGRIAIGTDKEEMKEFFTRDLNIDADIFSRVMMEGADLLIQDVHDKRWETLIPAKYHTNIKAKSLVISSVRAGPKPLGFVYADKGKSIDPIHNDQHRGFIQFIAQARLALQACR